MKCWAKSVSTSCCNVQSREHYISQGLFPSEMVWVSGFKFLNGETRLISIKSLVRNCLCETHNNALSPFDAEAIKFACALKYAVTLHKRRVNEKPIRWSVHRKRIDYSKIKKWFVKTILGMEEFFANNHELMMGSDFLAKLVFGDIEINDHVSLEIIGEVGDDMVIDKVVSVWPVYSESYCVGIIIDLYGFKLVCKIGDHENAAIKRTLNVNFRENKYLSYVINLK